MRSLVLFAALTLVPAVAGAQETIKVNIIASYAGEDNQFGQEFVTELKERFASAGLYSVVATGDALIDVSVSSVRVNADMVPDARCFGVADHEMGCLLATLLPEVRDTTLEVLACARRWRSPLKGR